MKASEIRAVRIANNIPQKDFAEYIDVPVGTWSNVELGRSILYKDVEARAVNTLKELGCDFSVLQEGIEYPLYTKVPHTRTPRTVVEGVGKDEPVVMNENGGGQSRSHYRLDLVDAKALLATAKVLKEGADKYGVENWRLIDVKDHLNHMLIHAYAYLAGDESDEHLSHITCRALFALGVVLQDEDDVKRANQIKQTEE